MPGWPPNWPKSYGPVGCRSRSSAWVDCLGTPEVADNSSPPCVSLPTPPTGSGPPSGFSPAPAGAWAVADLAALGARERARALSISRDPGGDMNTDSTTLAVALHEVAPESAERAGLVDAIADPGPPERYSAAGYRRVIALGAGNWAMLRERAAQPLTELVADVERSGGRRRDRRPYRRRRPRASGRVPRGRRGVTPRAQVALAALLAFLDAAETEEGLGPGEVEVAGTRAGPHRARGEGPGVGGRRRAAPRRQVFPGRKNTGAGCGLGAARPAARRRRGPAGARVSAGADRKEVQQGLDRARRGLGGPRLVEERRLFYVALTRAGHVLLVSAHRWDETGDRPRGRRIPRGRFPRG